MKKLYFEPELELFNFYGDVLSASNPDDPYGDDKDWEK